MPGPVADNDRLSVGAQPAMVLPARPAAAPNLLSKRWAWFTISEPAGSATSERAGWTFTVDPHLHQIRASQGGRSWAFVADARLAADFAVSGSTVVVGSHDGFVYGLDLASGSLRWRYLAAPAFRSIVVNGQLASAWPVIGVADAGDGLVVASAGTHVELEGGVRVVGLKAESGRPEWVRTLSKPPSTVTPGGGKETVIVDRSLINSAPAFIDGQVVFDGGFHLGKFSFRPTESDAELRTRLSTPAGKRN
jgi:outer membrane protein assembly factor BamB